MAGGKGEVDPVWLEFLDTMNGKIPDRNADSRPSTAADRAAERGLGGARAVLIGVPAALLLWGVLYGVYKVVEAVFW